MRRLYNRSGGIPGYGGAPAIRTTCGYIWDSVGNFYVNCGYIWEAGYVSGLIFLATLPICHPQLQLKIGFTLSG